MGLQNFIILNELNMEDTFGELLSAETAERCFRNIIEFAIVFFVVLRNTVCFSGFGVVF